MTQTAEHKRLTGASAAHWKRWGSYVAARCWGTVRESGDTEHAWDRFPFEQARSRAMHWSEDGIAGFSDDQQRLCLTVAFWNEMDPILKERFFGLTNDEGVHGEDVKEYFFFVDALPSHSYLKMIYRYPQVEYPYRRLVHENALRADDEPPFELIDALHSTLASGRYFEIEIEFAKAGPDDLLYRVTATNRGDRPAPLHVLPHLFYRNTWQHGGDRPVLRADGDSVVVQHPDFAGFRWYVDVSADLLFTDNETNAERLYDGMNESPFTKDGIDDAVVHGRHDRVNAAKTGTKCAAHYRTVVGPQQKWVVRSRLSPGANAAPFSDFDTIVEGRRREADEFYAEVQRDVESAEDRALQRAAFAGLNWNKSFYHFNVKRWMRDVAIEQTAEAKDNPFKGWEMLDAHDILSIPDPWEYPWLASWDVSFQIATLAIIDREFAKQQALMLLSDRYCRPDGAMAAFEDKPELPHPPVHAWAVLHIFNEAERDRAFLEAAYPPLKRHFDWWLKQHQPEDHLFDGGFVGKDNISIINRNDDIPEGGWIAQVDSTGWMAHFALHMLAIAAELRLDDDALYFLQHFFDIRKSLQKLWDKNEGYFFDTVKQPKKKRVVLKVRSLGGMIPLVAAMLVDPHALDALPSASALLNTAAAESPDFRPNDDGCVLLSVVPQRQIKQLLNVLFDPEEFLSPFGLRSMSKVHAAAPVSLELGGKSFELEYKPDYSDDNMLGGNSNWRGPVWAPLNQVLIEALYTYHQYFRTPVIQQGRKRITADDAARLVIERMLGLFKLDDHGRRPYLGENMLFQRDLRWRDLILFYEHFDPETGKGLGASHQNGWTALVARLIHAHGRGRLSLKKDSRESTLQPEPSLK